MKTHQEIQAEAQRLMVLGQQYQNEQRSVPTGAVVMAAPRALVALPVNELAPRRERHVEAAMQDGALMFRLMERENNLFGTDEGPRDDESAVVTSGPSAYDVLRTGYELAEEERLDVALEPYAERSEDNADGETVGEVEAILETSLLPHSDRIRTKAEVIGFLKGRLKPSVLIAHAVQRQCSRDGLREQQAERQELKLTIGEP
jgi:hypothetical protein